MSTFENCFFNEDCITGAKKHLPDESVDLIFADPPFGIQGKSLEKHYNRNSEFVLEGYVDVSMENYNEFSQAWISEAFRALKPSGIIMIVSGYNNLAHILQALKESGFNMIQHVIWHYSFGIFTKHKYVTSHYHILIYQKPGWWICGKVMPHSVMTESRENKPGEMKNQNQLPLSLVKRLIQSISLNDSAVVADFFLGGFTTAFAAIDKGYKVTGFEINPVAFKYFEPMVMTMISMKQTNECFIEYQMPNKSIATKVDLIIAYPNQVPPESWLDQVQTRMKVSASFYFICKSENLLSVLVLMTRFRIVNHIIWDMSEYGHFHILYYTSRTNNKPCFNTEAFFPLKKRTRNDKNLNYAHRLDVWQGNLKWEDVIEKILCYSSYPRGCVATFCAEDLTFQTIIKDNDRVFVE